MFSEVNRDDDDDYKWWWWYDDDDDDDYNVGAVECEWVIEYDYWCDAYDDDSYNNDDEQSSSFLPSQHNRCFTRWSSRSAH